MLRALRIFSCAKNSLSLLQRVWYSLFVLASLDIAASAMSFHGEMWLFCSKTGLCSCTTLGIRPRDNSLHQRVMVAVIATGLPSLQAIVCDTAFSFAQLFPFFLQSILLEKHIQFFVRQSARCACIVFISRHLFNALLHGHSLFTFLSNVLDPEVACPSHLHSHAGRTQTLIPFHLIQLISPLPCMSVSQLPWWHSRRIALQLQRTRG